MPNISQSHLSHTHIHSHTHTLSLSLSHSLTHSITHTLTHTHSLPPPPPLLLSSAPPPPNLGRLDLRLNAHSHEIHEHNCRHTRLKPFVVCVCVCVCVVCVLYVCLVVAQAARRCRLAFAAQLAAVVARAGLTWVRWACC